MAKIVKTYWGIAAAPLDVTTKFREGLGILKIGGKWLKRDNWNIGTACDDGPVLFKLKRDAAGAAYPDLGEEVVKLRVTIEEIE
jgi:hypothetical protein